MLRSLMLLVVAFVLTGLVMGCEVSRDSGTTDATQTDTTGENQTLPSACEDFCTGIVEACPTEDTMDSCLHSCEEADTPQADAIDCAGAALVCNDAHSCWTMLYD